MRSASNDPLIELLNAADDVVDNFGNLNPALTRRLRHAAEAVGGVALALPGLTLSQVYGKHTTGPFEQALDDEGLRPPPRTSDGTDTNIIFLD